MRSGTRPKKFAVVTRLAGWLAAIAAPAGQPTMLYLLRWLTGGIVTFLTNVYAFKGQQRAERLERESRNADVGFAR